MRLGFLVLLLGIAVVPSARAFNFQSHSVICQLAYEQLTKKTQQRIDAVMKKSPFGHYAEACPWPDKIRQQAEFRQTKTWHYINVPRGAEKVRWADCSKKGCLLSAIEQMQARLAKQPNNDWQALLFLSHFVGDLHQPMHVSYADDFGGNKVHLQQGKKATNLHQVWDSGLLSRKAWRKQSEQWLPEISPQDQRNWRQGQTLDWAQESYQLTQDAYRLLPASKKIGKEYRAFFAPKLELRVKQASVRLAMLLEQIYAKE